MLLYAYVIWLAALHALGCGPDGDELHKLLLGILPLVLGALYAQRATRRLPEVHSMLRWLGVPLLLLLPFGLRSVWDAFRVVHIDAIGLCLAAPPSLWHQLWSPLQCAVVLLLCFILVQNLRQSASKENS